MATFGSGVQVNDSDQLLATRSEESRYGLLLDSITDYAIYMLDPAGMVTSWNAGARRVTGYLAPEILGRNFSKFYTEEDRAANRPQRTLQIAAKRGSFESEGWRVRKDGTRFWAHVVIDTIRNSSGELIGFAKITRDLTERKNAAEALRQSEEQFRLLVQSVTDYAIYMLDPEGYVSSWNAGAQRIKGYSAEEIIGRHFSVFYTEDDRKADMPRRALETAAREGRFEKESYRLRKDGTKFLAHVVIDRIHDDKGNLIGFAKITRDITEREENRLALERTREQLFQSQKMEAIGKLTGGVAHDFNNLLMVIQGSLELIQKRMSANPQLMPLLQNALRATERGTALTQRMLAFARKQDIERKPVDIAALVRETENLLKRSLGPSYLIRTQVDDALLRAFADASQVETALLNLAFNARDAMPDGGSITIGVHMKDEGGLPARGERYVSIAVTDTGHGMDADTLRQATDPFFTTKGIGKGTGLGLSMVQGMAEQTGGKFRLASQVGFGTTAELLLPVAPDHIEAVPGAEEQGTGAEEARALVIVAVDDDPLVLMNTSAMLEDLGHTVFEASSVSQALKLIGETKVDLVITDQAMPGMTGIQFARTLRETRPELPVLLATGYAEIDAADDFDLPRISKPYLQRDLKMAIDKLLRGR